MTERRVAMSSSRAKLKIRMTSKEKTSMADSSSRERNSAARSFQVMAATARRKEGFACTAAGLISVVVISNRQGLFVERQQVALTELLVRRRGSDHPT